MRCCASDSGKSIDSNTASAPQGNADRGRPEWQGRAGSWAARVGGFTRTKMILIQSSTGARRRRSFGGGFEAFYWRDGVELNPEQGREHIGQCAEVEHRRPAM